MQGSYAGQSINYQLRNAVPTQLTIFNQPRHEIEKYRILGLFAQDQWTLRRLTVNAGVRLDTHVGAEEAENAETDSTRRSPRPQSPRGLPGRKSPSPPRARRLDLANLFNSNTVLVLNTTYGSNWQRPTYVLPGRLIKPTLQIDF